MLSTDDGTNDVNFSLIEHVTGDNLISPDRSTSNNNSDSNANLVEENGEGSSIPEEYSSSDLHNNFESVDPLGFVEVTESEEEVENGNTQFNFDNHEMEIEGRRLVDFNFVLDQLREISEHSDECLFTEAKLESEIRNGLNTKLIFRCSNCGKNFVVGMTASDTLCINSTAVLATNMIGIGYSQLEQLASVLNVPVMCAENYKKFNDKVGTYWRETADESMRKAAEEERKIAIELGDVDDDGIPFTTVVVDGTYSKRAYNKNYTALSGVAAIVGCHTGKILWIGVKNKYCVICVRSANKNISPAPHACTKNYSGPSSEMEWQSILQGFQCSVQMYNLRYTKVIGDGDSSTYAKLMEHRPYGDRYILKYECRNHLRRNYRKQLDLASVGCPKGLREHVVKSLGRIIRDINSAIEFRNKENKTDEEKVTSLKSDINNVVHHVFGDHTNCPSYVKEHCKDDENYIPALQKSGTYEKLAQPTRRLVYCASDLLLGHTNNPAEHYNSIVAKFIGGKRVNFSLSNSYDYKCNASAVQYNEKSPLEALYRTNFNSQPPSLSTKIQLKRLRKTARDKERRKFLKENKIYPPKFCRKKEKGTGYGVQEDLPPLAFEAEKKIFTEKLETYQQDRVLIEQKTRDKHVCSLWEEVHRKVLMASYFGLICKARSMVGHVKTISQGSYAQTKAMKHAIECQAVAINQIRQEQQLDVVPCGLFIDKEHACLAASPTATAGTDMIVHVECPISVFNKDLSDISVLGELLNSTGTFQHSFGEHIENTHNRFK